MRPSKRIKGIQEIPEVKVKFTETKAAPKAKTGNKPESSSRPLIFSHVEVPSPKDVKKQLSRRVEAIEVSSSENDLSDDDEERPVQRLGRKVSKMAVYVDSDSEGEKPTKAARGSKKRARSESPDFIVSDSDGEDDDDGDSDSDHSVDVSDGEDSDAPKAKSRAKPKAKPKARAKPKKTAQKSESDDVMDVDEPVSTSEASSSKSKKRKRVEKPKKPKELREVKDPWKLRSTAKRDWKQMQAPPLEMFHFSRKVVDEYTYLDGKIHALVTRITADRHWVLSGTPPIHDFTAVKTIAAHLNLHLGIDDDNEGKSGEVRKRRREQTGASIAFDSVSLHLIVSQAVEKFHSFRETHSLDWHAHRHELGQTFLNRFVRQVCVDDYRAASRTESSTRISLRLTRFLGKKRSKKFRCQLLSAPSTLNSNTIYALWT
jgi:hypothetical protein